MNLILTAAAALLLFSCSLLPPSQTLEPADKLKEFITEFKEQHPDMMQNDLIRSRTNDAFFEQLTQRLHGGLMDSVPLRLRTIRTLEDGTYAASFEYSSNYPELIFCDVIGLVRDSSAYRLTTKKNYYLKGTYQRPLPEDSISYYTSIVNTILFSVASEEVECGSLIYELHGFTEIPSVTRSE